MTFTLRADISAVSRPFLSPAIWLLGLVIAPLPGLAQSASEQSALDTIDLAFSRITINEGLSQGMVGAIAQDHHGFMWFGTKDGLNRYDGYTFTVFRHDATDSTTVRESTITGMHCDRFGRLWVGTATGLDLFDERTERFVHVPIRHPRGDWGGVVHILLDDNGDLWVSSTWHLLKLTFATPFTGYDLPSFTTTWFGNGFATVCRTRDGQLWGNFDEFTFRIRPQHDAPDLVDTIGTIGYFNGKERFGGLTVVEDTVSNKAYGIYQNGIVELNTRTGDMTELWRDRVVPNWLQTLNPVIDKRGMLWIATFWGLFRFDPSQRQLTRVQASDPDLDPMMKSLKWTGFDRTGTLWLGTTGYGLLKYDPKTL